jgi:hypothetical protein
MAAANLHAEAAGTCKCCPTATSSSHATSRHDMCTAAPVLLGHPRFACMGPSPQLQAASYCVPDMQLLCGLFACRADSMDRNLVSAFSWLHTSYATADTSSSCLPLLVREACAMAATTEG